MNSGELARMRCLIDRHRANGEYVLHSARMVGDEEDYAIWRQSRHKWCEETIAVVAKISPQSTDEFRLYCRVPAGGENWKQQYVAELKTVETVLEQLAELDEDLEPRALSAVFA